MNDISLGDKRGNVTKGNMTTCLDRFATLVTRLDFLDVTTNPLGCHACHPCHVNNDDKLVSSFDSQVLRGKKACIEWLKIVMEEGHLEPSQSWVGKAVGWPKRNMPIKSLWTDFCIWFRKQEITDEEMPEEYYFYELLDHLFIRQDDKYEFPILEKCRDAFVLLRQHYESD